jgi:Purine catabolism regulatory protein-like family/PucR C-terminal helix-turn-helix domain/GGDEF-like domain
VAPPSAGGPAPRGPLTIRELCEIPYLGTRIIAGAGGAERIVTWAHASEIEQPWEWLETGDLLMTLGLGLPATPEGQAAYVEKLAAAGMCGIAFAEGIAPPLSDALIDAAERCALPILYTEWNIPFGPISRAVAAANYESNLGQLIKTARVYDLVRAAVAARSPSLDLLESLSAETRCRLYVCVNDGGRAAFGDEGAPPPQIHAAFLEALDQHNGKLPGFLRLAVGDDTVVVLPIPTERGASLIAVPRSDVPAFAILQHIATAAALELERMWLTREELRRLGSETLSQLLEGRLIQGTAEALRRLGVEDRLVVVLALSHAQAQALSDLHNTFADYGIPNLLLQTGGVLYAMLPAEADMVAEVSRLLPADSIGGWSDPFDDPTKTPTAAQQAKWALGNATAQQPLVHYGETTMFFGPRSRAEAQLMVDQVLGPVITYDRENETDLMHSLRVFLQCNRSWKQAATLLFVHKQTLIYRIHRVEEMTGRKLSDTEDVVDLWLALRAFEMLGET